MPELEHGTCDLSAGSIRNGSHCRPDYITGRTESSKVGAVCGSAAREGSGLQSTYSTGINYNRFFSNTLVAEFRVGVAWYHNEAHSVSQPLSAR
jgi:hypothetical protein